jgi:hypothetical protein
MDQKLAGAGVKPEQIKVDGADLPVDNVSGAEEHGIEFRLDHITIRQALDLGYELEHTDPSLHLGSVEFTADATDPHYYAVGFKIVNFAPKVAEISLPAAGGKGIADAIKDKGGGKPALPPGLPPPGGG